MRTLALAILSMAALASVAAAPAGGELCYDVNLNGEVVEADCIELP